MLLCVTGICRNHAKNAFTEKAMSDEEDGILLLITINMPMLMRQYYYRCIDEGVKCSS